VTAGAVLEQLDKLGVGVTLDGSELVLVPGSKVPPELVSEVRAHKPEIIAALRTRTVPADTGLRPLLERLRRGAAWLRDHYTTYLTGLEPEGPYVASLVAWDTLEKLFRRLYGYEGCISETGACDPAAPVWCRACADARDREAAP